MLIQALVKQNSRIKNDLDKQTGEVKCTPTSTQDISRCYSYWSLKFKGSLKTQVEFFSEKLWKNIGFFQIYQESYKWNFTFTQSLLKRRWKVWEIKNTILSVRTLTLIFKSARELNLGKYTYKNKAHETNNWNKRNFSGILSKQEEKRTDWPCFTKSIMAKLGLPPKNI